MRPKRGVGRQQTGMPCFSNDAVVGEGVTGKTRKEPGCHLCFFKHVYLQMALKVNITFTPSFTDIELPACL